MSAVQPVEPWAKWTWRQNLAHWIHRLAYVVDPPESHELIIRDKDGGEFFSVSFQGGFAASHPPEPFTFHCRHDDDEEFLL